MNDNNPDSVEEVDYSRKNLTRMPEEIQQFPNLLRLDLSYNTIFRIDSFQNFRLDKLKLSHNRIVRLENLYSLKSLRTLDVSHNYISIAVLRGLSNLRVLILKRNSFFDLPDLRDLTNLRVLDCSFNKLSSLPDLSSLTNLKILRVNNNLIEEIPQLPNSVEMFNIGSNRISFFLQIRILENCKHLHNLVICNNPFSSIFFQNGINYRPFVVSFFTNLKELDVEAVDDNNSDRDIEPKHIEIFHDSDDDIEFINQLHRSLLLGLKKKQIKQKEEIEIEIEPTRKKKKKKRKNKIKQTPFKPSPIKIIGEHIESLPPSTPNFTKLSSFKTIDVIKEEEENENNILITKKDEEIETLQIELRRVKEEMMSMKRIFSLLQVQRQAEENRAARKIQFYCRRRIARKRLGFYKYRTEQKQKESIDRRTDSEIIHFLWDEVKELRREKEREIFEKQNLAALRIQKVWKGYITRKWYRKLRIEYLKFKEGFLINKQSKNKF